jgi:hypothetical protein
MAHILVDTANTFFRARHVIRGDTSVRRWAWPYTS